MLHQPRCVYRPALSGLQDGVWYVAKIAQRLHICHTQALCSSTCALMRCPLTLLPEFAACLVLRIGSGVKVNNAQIQLSSMVYACALCSR